MANAPVFAATPVAAVVQATTANTNRDGTGTIATLLTAGSSGTVVNKIAVCGTGTTTAGAVRLFLHDGSNYRLLRELMVPANTPSTTVEVWKATLVFTAYDILFLPNGWSLRVSTHNTETFNCFAFGANL